MCKLANQLTCITHITKWILDETQVICPIVEPLWHNIDIERQECVCTFLPPNEQGNSKKEKWADDHIKFIAENEDDPYFLAVYADSSLKNKDRQQQTGYAVVGYHLGRTTFKI